MKTNTHFAKLHNRVPEYAPIPLLLVIHHHEEYDIDVLDPETGEPTGETEHVVNDWDTIEKKIHPSPNDYIIMGWLPVLDKAPSPELGYVFQKTGYADEIDGKIVMEYKKVPVPTPIPKVRTFSKLKLVGALMDLNMWDSVKAYIEQAGLYDLFLAAQNFREDNEHFMHGKQLLQQETGLSDIQVEAILNVSTI